MDLAALLAPGAAPTPALGTPATGTPAGVPSAGAEGAFADVFAQALDGAQPSLDGVQTLLESAVPVLADAVATPPPTVPTLPMATVVPDAPIASAGPPEAAVSEKGETSEWSPPPELPVDLPEKEAPTMAPNAPVTPLDRSSEPQAERTKIRETPKDDAPLFGDVASDEPRESVGERKPSSEGAAAKPSRKPGRTSPARDDAVPTRHKSPSRISGLPVDVPASDPLLAEVESAPAEALPTNFPGLTEPKESRTAPSDEPPQGDPMEGATEVPATILVPQPTPAVPSTVSEAPVLPDAPDLAILPRVQADLSAPAIVPPTFRRFAPDATTPPKDMAFVETSYEVPDAPRPVETPNVVAPAVSAPETSTVPVPTAASPILNAAVANAVSSDARGTVVPIVKPSAPKSSTANASAVEGESGSTSALPTAVGATLSESDSQDRDPSENPHSGSPAIEAPSAGSAKTVATERPEEGTQRPSVDRHLVVKQVADRIENLAASRPRDGVTIHLEPRDLGTVTLVVKGLSSALDVQMFASDDKVRESLDASRTELAQSLAPRGIAVRDLKVDVASNAPASSSSSGSSTSGNAGSNPEGRPRQAPTPSSFFSSPGKSRETASSSPKRASRPGRGVDLLV